MIMSFMKKEKNNSKKRHLLMVSLNLLRRQYSLCGGKENKVKIIGITGKSGSGKSTLTKLLAKEMKSDCIDIDQIGHEATYNKQIAKRLCEVWGQEILGNDGKIDRKKLGKIVFSNKEKMDILTDITWDYMQEKLDNVLQKHLQDTIILEWALLPISKYWEKCDIKILMKAEDEKRKIQVMQRDKISEEYFLIRDANSINYEIYEFDYIFDNNYKPEIMEKLISRIK